MPVIRRLYEEQLKELMSCIANKNDEHNKRKKYKNDKVKEKDTKEKGIKQRQQEKVEQGRHSILKIFLHTCSK